MTTISSAPLAPEAIPAFARGGKATLTVVSVKTGTRFTFKARAPGRDRATGEKQAPEKAGVRFVSVLTGPENSRDYETVGMLFADGNYCHWKKSRIGEDAPSAKVAKWFFGNLDRLPKVGLEVWHHAHCGRCGRKLTVPSSIATGLGPECAGKVHG